MAAMQVEAVELWSIDGPFEVTGALADVGGARLGGFAEGWRDIGDMSLRAAPACAGSTVLLRVGCDTLEPAARDINSGQQLENTFGSTQRRFIAHRGQYEAQFDPRF